MSMISEQIKRLHATALAEECLNRKECASILREAAMTIEDLSAKLASANMERSTRYYEGGAFEKIKERVCEFIHERNKSGYAPCKNQRASCLQLIRVCDLTAIVNQVAEEYSSSEKPTSSNDGWIPCSERLPKESGYYMACIYNTDVDEFDFRKTWFAHVDDYDAEESEWRELYYFEEVTAWQPLPTPYQPKGE